MTNRLQQIADYQRAYWGVSLYDCIMSVADVCDLDNEELAALEREFLFSLSACELTLTEGNK